MSGANEEPRRGSLQGVELPCENGEEVARMLRALGAHRYVASRLVLAHAALFDAVTDIAEGTAREDLAEALAWSREVLRDSSIDPASRDERLHRRATEKEVAAALALLWGDKRAHAQQRLRAWLLRNDLAPRPDAIPFDESNEEDIHPLLVDAGWELVPIAQLNPERHRGAIEAFGEAIAFQSARFEEESAIPPRVTLHELSAIGPIEALAAIGEEGRLVAPLVLWTEGDPTYLDYVLRGALRAAKLSERPTRD